MPFFDLTQSLGLSQLQRVRGFAYDYLRTVARTEWQLGLLAIVGIAPGVATLVAWNNLALALGEQRSALLLGWLLPQVILDQLGAAGVLVGAGVVTLLIGALGLTNVYLASLERRRPQLLLLRRLGLRYPELQRLLTAEAIAIGLLGSGIGLLFGVVLSWLSWRAAADYLALSPLFRLSPLALVVALGVGLSAVLLFLLTAARLQVDKRLDGARRSPSEGDQLTRRNSWLGTGYGVLLTLLAALPILPLPATVLLAGIAGVVGLLLNGAGWMLTHLYSRLPLSPQRPLWTLAVQSLARHPNHTAGMTLAMTSGAYAVGMAGLSWLVSHGVAHFPFWVAALILVASTMLVFTVAALSIYERRNELSLLRALGAQHRRLWHLILLEYGLVALGGGAVGAGMAFVNWLAAGVQAQWLGALALLSADLIGALLTAWIGALPVLWYLTRKSVDGPEL